MKSLLLALALLLPACLGQPLEADAPDLLPPCGAIGQECCTVPRPCEPGLICLLPVGGDPEATPHQCFHAMPR